jgi:hypothetical protein
VADLGGGGRWAAAGGMGQSVGQGPTWTWCVVSGCGALQHDAEGGLSPLTQLQFRW